MDNFNLAVLSTLCCLLLGSISSGLAIYGNLTGDKLWLAWFLGMLCLPLSPVMAYQAMYEFTWSDKIKRLN